MKRNDIKIFNIKETYFIKNLDLIAPIDFRSYIVNNIIKVNKVYYDCILYDNNYIKDKSILPFGVCNMTCGSICTQNIIENAFSLRLYYKDSSTTYMFGKVYYTYSCTNELIGHVNLSLIKRLDKTIYLNYNNIIKYDWIMYYYYACFAKND